MLLDDFDICTKLSTESLAKTKYLSFTVKNQSMSLSTFNLNEIETVLRFALTGNSLNFRASLIMRVMIFMMNKRVSWYKLGQAETFSLRFWVEKLVEKWWNGRVTKVK